jgi:2-polyprenyl-3-methyl-5-hydroxy-6-metoxy-1,4-benzoquinol methylase
VQPGQSDDQTRVVQQAPRGKGHILQPSWRNPEAFRPRIQQLLPIVAGRDVLDVGCTSAIGRPDWIHAALAAAAGSIVGVDIDAAAVTRAQELGFDVRLADAEVLSLPESFDVVHAGELIEHLDNPRAFLAACRARLRPDGRLVLTTPNPFAVSNFVYRLGGTPKVNGDHTCWYCEDTLRQLLERNGYAVDSITYLHHETPGRWRARLTRIVRSPLPDRVAWNTLVAVARPAASAAPPEVPAA